MKLGIALGGGGAKGFAHIGVLQVLKENGIDCEIISGTSVGALVGAVYASNALGEFTEEALSIKPTDIPLLLSPSFSIKGLFSVKNALEKLNCFVSEERIEDFSKKYAAVAVDILSGSLKTFTSGSVADAMRASMAIPLIFTPMIIEQSVFVDGGIIEPVPVLAARTLGAQKVIAVDLFGNTSLAHTKEKTVLHNKLLSSAMNQLQSLLDKLPQRESSKQSESQSISMIDITEKTLAIVQSQLTEARLSAHPADILIQPAVADVGILDFHRGEEVVKRGRYAMDKNLGTLRELLKDN